MARITTHVAMTALLALLIVGVVHNRSRAESQDQPRKGAGDEITDRKTKRTAPIDHEIESQATALVDAHLSELKSLLRRLRNSQPQEYDRAMRDLAKSARKLELAKNRDGQLYDIEVELLQARTQANLLTAKLKVRDNERDRKQLRAAAARLHRATIARAQYDVAMYQTRVKRTQRQLDAALKRLESKQNDADAQLAKSYNAMLRKAGRRPQPDTD